MAEGSKTSRFIGFDELGPKGFDYFYCCHFYKGQPSYWGYWAL